MPTYLAETATPHWVRLHGGRFQMGSSDFFPEEAPRHEACVEPFEITLTPTTNRQFAAFVAATGYVTVAERALEGAEFELLADDQRAPGSLVFTPTAGPVDLRDWRSWWRWVPGAQWRHPLGPDSDLTGKEEHPVVQVAYADALAYADWAGGRLPTEAEHEYASGGGATPAPYAWGGERDPGGVLMANTWHGRFPYRNDGADGWVGTSPVGSFPPNGFGLFDCIGNVWEWTVTPFRNSHMPEMPVAEITVVGGSGEVGCRCGPSGRAAPDSVAAAGLPRQRVLKGGSHLCAPEYCLRYRPAARSSQAEDSATSHLGFRCVR